MIKHWADKDGTAIVKTADLKAVESQIKDLTDTIVHQKTFIVAKNQEIERLEDENFRLKHAITQFLNSPTCKTAIQVLKNAVNWQPK